MSTETTDKQTDKIRSEKKQQKHFVAIVITFCCWQPIVAISTTSMCLLRVLKLQPLAEAKKPAQQTDAHLFTWTLYKLLVNGEDTLGMVSWIVGCVECSNGQHKGERGKAR